MKKAPVLLTNSVCLFHKINNIVYIGDPVFMNADSRHFCLTKVEILADVHSGGRRKG